MCLSVPARIIEMDGADARADVAGVIVQCNTMLLDDVQIGDYVLVHAGFAIQKYSLEDAQEILELLREALNADT